MMDEIPFHQRLEVAMERAGFNVADLSQWFDRSYPTVRYWLYGDPKWPRTGPRTHRKDAFDRLILLEWALDNVHGFPISPRLARTARADEVKRLYAGSQRLSVSQAHTASGGV